MHLIKFPRVITSWDEISDYKRSDRRINHHGHFDHDSRNSKEEYDDTSRDTTDACYCSCKTCSGPQGCCQILCIKCRGEQDSLLFVPYAYPMFISEPREFTPTSTAVIATTETTTPSNDKDDDTDKEDKESEEKKTKEIDKNEDNEESKQDEDNKEVTDNEDIEEIVQNKTILRNYPYPSYIGKKNRYTILKKRKISPIRPRF